MGASVDAVVSYDMPWLELGPPISGSHMSQSIVAEAVACNLLIWLSICNMCCETDEGKL